MSLDAAGLVALADLNIVATRTALTGTSSLFDALIICPGMHKQQDALRLNEGDYPICAAMTTDYVFRIENQATVFYLQKFGRTGQLTTVSVSTTVTRPFAVRFVNATFNVSAGNVVSTMAYVSAIILSVAVLMLLALLEDWWGFGVIGIFVLIRIINIIIVKRQAVQGWKGEPEPGQQSDLIILLSQDRWIRMRGAVDDVKAITSGEWLRKPTSVENALLGFATLLTYFNAGLSMNSTTEGNVILLILLCSSAGLLGLANEYTKTFRMYGRRTSLDGPRKRYNRRLTLAKELIKETGRSDWAIRLGMAQASDIETLEEAARPVESACTFDKQVTL